MSLDRGRRIWTVGARLGTSDRRPRFSAAVEGRRPLGGRWFLSAYRRLDAANEPDVRRPGLALEALLAGKDDGQWYEVQGGNAGFTSRPFGSAWWRLEAFAERHRAVPVTTSFSLPWLLDAAHTFGPALDADGASLFGARARLRLDRGRDPRAARTGMAARIETAGGDFRYGVVAAAGRASVPLGPARLSLELEGGGTLGAPPVQRLWHLGGSGTARGHPGGATRGRAFGRLRTEVAVGSATARAALFGDHAWVGHRPPRTLAHTAAGWPGELSGVGLGVSLLDGLVRLDAARGLGPTGEWRAYVRVDGT